MIRKLTYSIMTAALLTVAVALLTAACSSDDNDAPTVKGSNKQTFTFTATLASKGGDDGQTRAITVNNQGEADETLTTSWEAGEEIAIYYNYYTDRYHSIKATVQTVNADGSATISADLDGWLPPMNGSTAKFVYPAYLVDYPLPPTTTSADVHYEYENEGFGLFHQYGNITGKNSISLGADSENRGGCDIAIGTGTMVVDGSDVTVNGSVNMENQVCICKFHFDFTGFTPPDGNQLIVQPSYTPITIDDGDGHTYTIESDRTGADGVIISLQDNQRGFYSTDDIYVAMLPISNKTVTFTAKLMDSSTETYTCTKTNVTLEKGKFYRNLGTITLVKQ